MQNFAIQANYMLNDFPYCPESDNLFTDHEEVEEIYNVKLSPTRLVLIRHPESSTVSPVQPF